MHRIQLSVVRAEQAFLEAIRRLVVVVVPRATGVLRRRLVVLAAAAPALLWLRVTQVPQACQVRETRGVVASRPMLVQMQPVAVVAALGRWGPMALQLAQLALAALELSTILMVLVLLLAVAAALV